MDTKLLVSNKGLLKLASSRVDLPDEKPLSISYDEEVDALFLRYSKTDSVISRSKDTDGIIFDYDSEDNLTGIEILDLYGIFV